MLVKSTDETIWALVSFLFSYRGAVLFVREIKAIIMSITHPGSAENTRVFYKLESYLCPNLMNLSRGLNLPKTGFI